MIRFPDVDPEGSVSILVARSGSVYNFLLQNRPDRQDLDERIQVFVIVILKKSLKTSPKGTIICDFFLHIRAIIC